jgi:hypothetical protein
LSAVVLVLALVQTTLMRSRESQVTTTPRNAYADEFSAEVT